MHFTLNGFLNALGASESEFGVTLLKEWEAMNNTFTKIVDNDGHLTLYQIDRFERHVKGVVLYWPGLTGAEVNITFHEAQGIYEEVFMMGKFKSFTRFLNARTLKPTVECTLVGDQKLDYKEDEYEVEESYWGGVLTKETLRNRKKKNYKV